MIVKQNTNPKPIFSAFSSEQPHRAAALCRLGPWCRKRDAALINLPAVLIANGLGASLMLTLLFSNRKGTRTVFLAEKLFFFMCQLTLWLCLVETFTFYIDGKMFPGAVFLNRLSNALLFITNSVFSFLWTMYVDYKLFGQVSRLRRIYPWVALPALAICLLAVLNLFTDVFFTVSADNIYSRTPLALITYLVTYFYLLGGGIMAFRYRHKSGKYLFMPVTVFLTPIFVGSLLQMVFYGLALIWVSVAFGLVSLYINLQNEISLLDPLTKLYNREYLVRYLNFVQQRSPGKKQMAGIMMDVNAFKEINDTLGHSEGDTALRLVGKCLMEVVRGDNFSVRYGGDEFIVICQVDSQQELDQLAARICRRVDRQNEGGALPYRLSLSMGCTFYDPAGDDIDSFLRRMDQNMYENKRRYYSDSRNDRRHRRSQPQQSPQG